MSNKSPAFLFYPSDFISGTRLFNFTQKGMYLELLCIQYEQGHLTYDDMIFVCGEYDKKIFDKFKIDADGLYYNPRLDTEKAKRQKFVESRSNNLNAPKESKNNSHMERHMECHMEQHTESRMENENIDINIINSIYLYWNSKNIIVHKELNKNTQEAVLKALETYSEEQIKTCIDRYAKVINDASYFWGYKWTLREFLTRKEGISAFTDEGSKWCSYQAFLKKPNPKLGVQPLESSFDTDEFFQAALERSEREMRERWGKK